MACVRAFMCPRARVCVCVNFRQQLRSNGASVMAQRPHRSQITVVERKSITDISLTLSDCEGQSKYGFSILTPSPSPTNKHTHSRVCLHLHSQHINEKHLQLHHFAWHMKIVSAFVLLRALGCL